MKTRILKITIALSILLIGMQSVSAQKQKSTTKAALIDEVVSLTLPAFPMAIHQKFYQDFAAKLPDFVMEEAKKAALKDVDKMSNLSSAQKQAKKAQVPSLMNQANAPIRRLIDSKFTGVDSLITSYFKESYGQYETGEIIELNRFITSDAGKSYLEAVKNISNNMNASKPKPLELKEKYQPQISAFLTSPVGEKFNNTFMISPEIMMKRLELLTTDVFKGLSTDPEITKIYEDFKKSPAN